MSFNINLSFFSLYTFFSRFTFKVYLKRVKKVCLACEKIKKSLPKTIKIVYNIYVTNMLD